MREAEWIDAWSAWLGAPLREGALADSDCIVWEFALADLEKVCAAHPGALPALVVPVCTAFALTQVLHTVFHLAHLDGFSLADGLTQMAALLGLTAAPVVAIVSCPAPRDGSAAR